MTPKRYSSFAEIDMDLRILKLEQEVDLESLKLSLKNSKQSLYPTNLLGGFGGIIQKLLLTLLAKKFFKKIT